MLPKKRFQDECKSFADLKINLHLLRKMTDARLWLRIVDPGYEPNLRGIRRLCASTMIADSSVSWAANAKEAIWVKELAQVGRMRRPEEENPRMRSVWRIRRR